jgi:diguanylate cyclase (GGDEF)-like protein
MRRERTLRFYSHAVTVAGLAALFGALSVAQAPMPSSELAFWIFAAAVILGEFLPIKVPGHAGELAISTTFIFVILLTWGIGPAIAVQAAASILADLRNDKPMQRGLFNVAQYTLAWLAAGIIVETLTDLGSGSSHDYAAEEVPALVLASAVFFAVNSVLVRTAVALSQNLSVTRFWIADLGFRGWTTGMMMGLAPAIAAVQQIDLVIALLIVLPVAAIHRAASESSRNEYLATHDELTGLPNRVRFQQGVKAALLDEGDGGRGVAVLLIDLDRFKEINDTLGHHHGDALLQQVGPRLQEVLPESGMAARLGGDEFAILLRPARTDLMAVMADAERLRATFDSGFHVHGVVLDVGASIGVAIHPEHGDDVETLMQRADVAMYRAKEAHTGVEVYDAGDDHHNLGRLAMAGELRVALERDELVLHYQPKLDLETGLVEQVEALVRWRHPQRGLVPPNDFIPLAEHTGLIRPMTKLVIEKALAQCAEWRRAGLHLRVAVNLSTRSLLDAALPGEVLRMLDAHGLEPQYLTLEITESILMADPERSARILSSLSEMGVHLALDDFGTGYSSLSYLKRLPVDELKIDGSFVKNMARDPDDAMIVRSTVQMARGLGRVVVAEGVEDEITLNRLRGFGCQMAQGYGISRPLPAVALEQWVRARQPEAAGLSASAGRTLSDVARGAV